MWTVPICHRLISVGSSVKLIRGLIVHDACGRQPARSEYVLTRSAAGAAPHVVGAIVGCAVPLDTPCAIFGPDNQTEHDQFDLGAFDDSLAGGGQELWVNHIRPALQGRFSRLAVDARELRFRFELLDGPRERRVLQQINAGSIHTCSIGYRYRPEFVRYGGTDGTTRVFSRVDLLEISLLDGGRPAWYGTWVKTD